MTEPAYGVVSCGNPAPGSFSDLELGPCVRTPGHEGQCRYRLGSGGFVELRKASIDFPEAEGILKDMRAARRRLQVALRVSVVCVTVTALCAIYSVLRAFGVI